MYSNHGRKRTTIEAAQEKAKAFLRIKQALIKTLKELQPDGLLSKEDIYKELEDFKASVEQISEEEVIEEDFEDEGDY